MLRGTTLMNRSAAPDPQSSGNGDGASWFSQAAQGWLLPFRDGSFHPSPSLASVIRQLDLVSRFT